MKRHNTLRDLIAEDIIPTATGMPAMVEKHDESHGDDRHPDISYQTWCGDTEWLDVAIILPMVRQGT